ncbi:B12-binding domain-containing radical SAM protein [Terriglobus albidus]|uniref:B12-binding domain-containing radical SAM protein n=1 Tax=Terriglobus albidus TaxID=1592106 RepID=A0A5B9EG21_9BACT|nr:radical SAM protein [Terriglobus albidus]QEE29006.1 B12-binding domain-containing radical SAM protein [Terriglobus albidus]
MARSRKIVFFFPSFASTEATAPLGILAVSTPLERAGYQICLVDSTITPDFQKRVLEEVKDALCLAVSLVTGPMIRETVAIARAVKEWKPDFPIVLGGWHPSLLPQQTLEAACVDYVVRGQGEDAMLELVQHLSSGSAPDLIAGIGFKRDGRIIFTPERPLRPLVEMPPKAYHLADFDAYERSCGRRWAMYTSSLACPFNCAYCTNGGVYGRKWNALPPEQFVEETVDLSRRYELEMLWVVDDNFLVDLDRARGIAEGLVRENSHYTWSIQATTNLVARLSLEDMRLLRRAGLRQVCQGVDSGSPTILKAMNKDFQDFESIYESAARCLEAGIRPSFNIIFAFPGEGPKERRETVEFMLDVCRKFPGAEFWTNIFTPYPGSPIFKRTAEIGIEPPTTLEGWADFFPRYTELPWLKGEDHKRLQDTREYLRLAFNRIPIAADTRPPIIRLAQKAISFPARWRLDHDAYRFPVDIWLNNKLKKRIPKGKPAVDAKRLARTPAEAAAC